MVRICCTAEYIYLFRSRSSLLGYYSELDKQEIYFAPPNQLNDSLEGSKYLFWKGDGIVWKDFLRHYVLCLMQAILRTLENGEDYRHGKHCIRVRLQGGRLEPEQAGCDGC